MKTVTIPTCANPFVVILNGIKYTFPAGETVEVSDEIAEVIMQHAEWHANHKYTPEGGSGCGCNGGLEVYEVSSPDEIAADAPDGFYVVPNEGSGESGESGGGGTSGGLPVVEITSAEYPTDNSSVSLSTEESAAFTAALETGLPVIVKFVHMEASITQVAGLLDGMFAFNFMGTDYVFAPDTDAWIMGGA